MKTLQDAYDSEVCCDCGGLGWDSGGACARCGSVRHGTLLNELAIQIHRLRKNVGSPGMPHGKSPEEVLAALRSEANEVEAEDPGSEAARREAVGCLAVAAHLIISHGGDVGDELAKEVDRLSYRLDVVESGGTWAEAKASEAHRGSKPWMDGWQDGAGGLALGHARATFPSTKAYADGHRIGCEHRASAQRAAIVWHPDNPTSKGQESEPTC